jgi:hypothetical protein
MKMQKATNRAQILWAMFENLDENAFGCSALYARGAKPGYALQPSLRTHRREKRAAQRTHKPAKLREVAMCVANPAVAAFARHQVGDNENNFF